jgi:hypothetical protein
MLFRELSTETGYPGVVWFIVVSSLCLRSGFYASKLSVGSSAVGNENTLRVDFLPPLSGFEIRLRQRSSQKGPTTFWGLATFECLDTDAAS